MGAELFMGQNAQEGEQELPASKKARGKAHTVEALPPPEMDADIAWWLQEEEREAKWVRWGQDAATLVVVREAAGLLMRGQVEGLVGAP